MRMRVSVQYAGCPQTVPACVLCFHCFVCFGFLCVCRRVCPVVIAIMPDLEEDKKNTEDIMKQSTLCGFLVSSVSV